MYKRQVQEEVLPKSSRGSDKAGADTRSTDEALQMIKLQETIEKLMKRMEQLETEIEHLKSVHETE